MCMPYPKPAYCNLLLSVMFLSGISPCYWLSCVWFVLAYCVPFILSLLTYCVSNVWSEVLVQYIIYVHRITEQVTKHARQLCHLRVSYVIASLCCSVPVPSTV